MSPFFTVYLLLIPLHVHIIVNFIPCIGRTESRTVRYIATRRDDDDSSILHLYRPPRRKYLPLFIY